MGIFKFLLTGLLASNSRSASTCSSRGGGSGLEEESSSNSPATERGDPEPTTPSPALPPPVEECDPSGREKQTVVSDLDGTLLRSDSSFPYFMLVAFEAGSPLRALLLLLLSPLAWLLYRFVSEAAGIKLLIFVSYAGLKASQIECVSRAVLTKFYLEDMHSRAYRVFIACGKRYVVTANPRIMVEPFLREYLQVDGVMGTEIEVTAGGYATGLVCSSGVLVGSRKRSAVEQRFSAPPDIGLGDRHSDLAFLSLCKEAYLVPRSVKVEAVPRHEYLKPLVFHDGRLVQRPTPAMSLLVFLWAPVGLVLALLRMSIGISIPMWWALPVETMLGVRVRIRGKPPASGVAEGRSGVLFVCSHRTLLDPIFLSIALRRNVTAVTYSISRVSEVLSPIKTVRLTRSRDKDAKMMATLLGEGDLVVCPEGTTCREPFLLRFSSLFAELADSIVPVTMSCQFSLFHGTSARGMKGMDPFFFFMNPSPLYEVTFLEQLPMEMTCAGGKSSHEVANYIQRSLGASLGFQCTNLTRRDKYRILVGNDGRVPENSKQAKKIAGC